MLHVQLHTQKTKKRSVLFFEIGMIIALSFTLWAFNYSSLTTAYLPDNFGDQHVDDDVTEIGAIIIEPDEPQQNAQAETQRFSHNFQIVPDPTPLPDPGPAPQPTPDPLPGGIQVNVLPPIDPGANLIENPVNWASQMPEFPGGTAAMMAFIVKELEYPALAIENAIQGRVMVSFVVEKDGSLSDIQIVTPVGWGIDQEAIRVVKLMPRWRPGENNYRPVRVRVHLPIKFQFR